MNDLKFNLMPEDKREQEKINLPKPPRAKKHFIRNTILSLLIVIIVFVAVFSSSIIFYDENDINSGFNIFRELSRLLTSGNRDLTGENQDRINLVLMGMGGSTHQAGNLADTIIVASFKPSTKQAAMMSVPRDLFINHPRFGQVKINSVYAYAEASEKGTGGYEMMKALENILDEEFHYFAAVDFTGFEKIIDEFDGVDIEVERDLIDYSYPARGKEDVYPIENRYEYLEIKKGLQHMDGSLALKYARSRHAQGIEGSDFARSQRQRKILTALKEKALSYSTLFNPRRLNSLLKTYNNHIKTNLEVWEMLRLYQLGKDISAENIINQGLDNSPGGLLYADSINKMYVLLPHNNDFSTIKKIWQYIFYIDEKDKQKAAKEGLSQAAPASQSPEKQNDNNQKQEEKLTDYQLEAASIEVQNGTWLAGFANREKEKMEEAGLIVSEAKNADRHDYVKTVIYDLSDGDFPATASKLASIYNRPPTTTIPLMLDSSADFVIILGEK